jgi:DNA-binding SARP family transcriptional activator
VIHIGVPGVLRVEIVLLGTVGVRSAGVAVDLGVRKHRFVLALLALEANSAVATDRIVDLVWRDGPPRSARRMVHGLVSGLRSALAGHATEEVRLVREGDGYALRCDPLLVDAHRFRALLERARTADDARRVAVLDEALALWRGPALAGIAAGGVRDGLSGGLEEARLGAVEDRVEARRRLGLPDAVDELLDLHRVHPQRPRLLTQLMLALHRAGRAPEALEVYRRARALLAEEHGLDVSADVERLHLAILRGETGQPPREGLAVTAAPVPAQLPADRVGLVGRDEQVAELVRAVSAARGELAVCAVDGAAGVGKTAVAVRAGRELAARFPDGRLFLDLHGFTPGRAPVTPLDALRHLLGSFGVDDVPGDVDSASARWRSLLAGRRVLLLLDDASSDAQVVPLLPGDPGCAVVLTGRRRLAAGGHAVPLTLEPLSPDASDALFRTAAGLSAAAPTGGVAALCGGLPLALRTAAARLRRRPTWTVDDLALLLADPAHRVAELGLDHAFDSSRAVLDVAARRAHTLLAGHAPVRFGAAGAAVLLGTTPRRARRLLEELVDLHLLVVDGADGYSFHDLVRLHAAS